MKRKKAVLELRKGYRKLFFKLKKEDFREEHYDLTQRCRLYFEYALINIDKNCFEVSFICFCIIIEGISTTVYSLEYQDFAKWLISKERKINYAKLQNRQSFKEEISQLYEEYLESYGLKRHFVKIITNAFEAENKLPHSALMHSKKEAGKLTIRFRQNQERIAVDVFEGFKKSVGNVYDAYRSTMLHAAEPLPFYIGLNSRIGGSLSPAAHPSVQELGRWVLFCMHYYFDLLKIKK